MLIHKTFKYRIYPSKTTIVRLDEWICTLRWLWNIANEQRLNGYGRTNGEKIYPTVFSQQRELTELRKCESWINDVPRHACSAVLWDLDTAWERCFKRVSLAPNWKKKFHQVGICETQDKKFKICNGKMKFPKLPSIPIVISRPLEGKPKRCVIKKDGDQWFAFIVCEVVITDPAIRTEPRVGIDRGVRNFIADSNNQLLPNPRFLSKQLKRLARAQRTVARRVRGSNNQKKASNKVNRLHRKVKRQREYFIHVESTRYAKSHGTVVMEDLKTRNMIRVRGSLARNIGDSGWGMFAEFLEYKMKWSGGTVIKVNPAYSSQTCLVCGHVDRESRTGDRFKCTNSSCTHEDHADSNGAKIVLSRSNRPVQPVEASSQRTRRRIRKIEDAKALTSD
jgi:putative transposase